jgi:Ca2+-binding RTX toxin-like protein
MRGRISAGLLDGIVIVGARSNIITNSGAISSGDSRTILMSRPGNILNNSGTLEVTDLGVAVQISGSVINSSGGIIQGGGVELLPYGPNSLNTSGTITGHTLVAVEGTNAVDTVTNSGLLRSNGTAAVVLFGGDDRYDGRLGRVIGEVLGGDNDDVLLGGAFVDVFRGGADNDVLNGGGGADLLYGGSGNDTYQLGAMPV